MTTAEYLKTEETVLPRELAYGELRVADSPSVRHQRVVMELALLLAPYVREKHLGEVLVAPMDVILDVEGALVVQPDLLFVSRERRQIVSDRVYGAPDLVIEVLSPHPRIGRVEEKVTWFARSGVRECWLVNAVEKRLQPERGAQSPSESEWGWGPASPEKAVVVLTLSPEGVRRRTMHRGAEQIQTDVLEGLSLTPLEIFGW